MRNFKYIWVVGLVFTVLIIIIPIWLVTTGEAETAADPWSHVPEDQAHTDHAALIKGPLATGSDVTALCLDCHADAADQVMHTTHWTWESQPVDVSWRDEPVAIGKKNVLNNFCIGIQSNWTGCTKCHAGYGWSDASFDFTQKLNVDCLVCHEQTGNYVKGNSGVPVEGVDLVSAAQSVAMPTRANCGYCHFNGGGGDAVKHGDMDTSLINPSENEDVHMGQLDFQCTDCHQTDDHAIKGRAISVSVDNAHQVYCTDCHESDLHDDDRINTHTDTVACQTCHVPAGAVRLPTKMVWDWSAAGQDLPEDPHSYLKIKGSFIYEENIMPDYAWHNGTVERYLLGDPIDPNTITVLNPLLGSIDDPNSKIWPFKIHRATQIYDTVNNYLIQPQTVGETGYWTTFDWDSAARNGMEAVGLDYSGEYGFTQTEMYWTLSHMVAPADQALQCSSCHGENGRMDWQALGYYGDPMRWGGRDAE